MFDNAGWLDATHVIGFGQKIGERSQGYIQDINGGPPRRFTPEGATVKALKGWTLPISPDGTRVVAMSDRDAAEIYPSTAVRVFRHLSGMSAACSPACARRHVAFARRHGRIPAAGSLLKGEGRSRKVRPGGPGWDDENQSHY